MTGLRQGTNRIEFTAVAASGADPSPVVRTVYLPVGSDRLSHTRGWTAGSGPAALYGRYLRTAEQGQSVGVHRSGVKRIALVAAKSRVSGPGILHSYFNGRRITDRPISLAANHSAVKQLIPVKTFSTARSGWVTVKVVSRGKPVRIEGIGIAAR